MNAMSFYRVARWLYIKHIPVLPSLIQALIFLIFNSKIAPTANIGKGTSCICKGMGVLLHNTVKIGENCTIGAHACIIGKSPYRKIPEIGNNVFIGHNTVICGPLIIGDNAVIANGAVVLKSVPKNAIVAGAPAKIIGFRNQLDYDLLHPQDLKDDLMPFLDYK